MGPYTRERIENWVSDFCTSDAMRDIPGVLREYAPDVLVRFLLAACEHRGIEPEAIEEADVKSALVGTVAKLGVPETARCALSKLCGAFLADLETQGRLGGGRVLGAYAGALKDAFEEAASGKPKPIIRPGSRLKRNDPCPCGSGKKYKKCCLNE